MPGNGRVFVSHAHDDNERCKPLLEAMKSWGVDYWFDIERIHAGDSLAARIEQEIEDRDVFIRVCSEAARRSFYVGLETDAFRSLLADDYNRGQTDKRAMISFIVDQNYAMEPFVRARLYVDAARVNPQVWIPQMRRALHVAGCMQVEPVANPQPTVERNVPDPYTPPTKPVWTPPTNYPADPSVREFIDNDAGYVRWMQEHPRGYIVNCERTPHAHYLMLHRPTCGWILRPIKRGDNLTGGFIKICSDDRNSLASWAKRRTGGDLQPCRLCKP